MIKSQINQLEKRIEKLLEKLVRIKPMRPGSISKQYRDRENQTGVYYQLSYTHKMKSRTEHVWPEHREGATCRDQPSIRSSNSCTGELIDLSIELSKGKITRLRNQSANS